MRSTACSSILLNPAQEHHYLAIELYKLLYRDLPLPNDGWLDLPTGAGLGFEPDRDAIRELAKLPLSHGCAKG